MERSKAESITAYLEARQKERAAPPVPASGGTSLGLLAALAGAPQWAMALAELQQIQRAILKNALECLASGGVLIYSTCSLEREENEDVVRAVAPDRVRAERLRVPGRHAGDGFYAAVLT